MEQVFEVNKTDTPAVSGKNADIEAGLRGDDHAMQVRDQTITTLFAADQATRKSDRSSMMLYV
jgi:hypothetical protein